MKENNIKGEHVFLSNDDDARFKADFDINGIPFGILIKKNGEFTTSFPCNLDYVFAKALEEYSLLKILIITAESRISRQCRYFF